MNALKWWKENPGSADEIIGSYQEADNEEGKQALLREHGFEGHREEVERMIRVINFSCDASEGRRNQDDVVKEMNQLGFSDEEKRFILDDIRMATLTSREWLEKALSSGTEKEKRLARDIKIILCRT